MRYSAAFFIGLTMALGGCDKDSGSDCSRSFGSFITEPRELGNFDRVEMEGRVDVDYRFAPTPSVEVYFGENLIEEVSTEVANGLLKIENKTECNWLRDLSKVPRVTVYAPTLAEWVNRASGDITFGDSLSSPDFTYQQWESNGMVKLLLNTGTAKIYCHVGFTELTANGRTQNAELFNGGVGKFNATGLIAQDVSINNSSLQDLFCTAENYLYAAIYANGNVRYRGQPTTIETNLQGSGRVRPF